MPWQLGWFGVRVLSRMEDIPVEERRKEEERGGKKGKEKE
jgi:hypothetical protein